MLWLKFPQRARLRLAMRPQTPWRAQPRTASQCQMEIDAVGQLGVPQLDQVRLAGNLVALKLEHREQVGGAGFALQGGDAHGFNAVSHHQ